MIARDGHNPWLSIPASDYEGHMGSPEVGQLQFLSDVFARLLATHRPGSLVVLGCATGNGFEHIRPEAVRRVVAVDINSDYLDLLRRRHGGRLPGLELVCADIASVMLESRSMDLVHAALVLEYVDTAIVVEKAAAWLRPGGMLSVVLQLPSDRGGSVTATRFGSLRALEPAMRLVDPRELGVLARARGLEESSAAVEMLPSGKSFFVGCWSVPGEHPRSLEGQG